VSRIWICKIADITLALKFAPPICRASATTFASLGAALAAACANGTRIACAGGHCYRFNRDQRVPDAPKALSIKFGMHATMIMHLSMLFHSYSAGGCVYQMNPGFADEHGKHQQSQPFNKQQQQLQNDCDDSLSCLNSN
jgi:hypothetical protein